jgi:hypothetical protein
MSTSPQIDCSRARIERLHAWYRSEVMDLPLVPEYERRWLAFCKQGFNGQQLARVIRWLRQQIAAGKRNAGALKLSNLFEWSEDGSLLRFAEDHALAAAQYSGRLATDRRLAPVPKGEGGPSAPPSSQAPPPSAPPPSNPDAAARALADLKRFQESLR